jgi:nitroreductase
MNETLAVIKKRRSIRKYTPEQIGDKELEAIMEAAIYAPSAMNQQKWHFTVIQNRVKLDEIMKTMRDNLLKSPVEFLRERARNPEFNVFYSAPTLVIITADEKAFFTELDCGMAAENITLAAESLGINSCVIGMSSALFESEKADEIKQELGIPPGYKFMISIALGYRDMETPPAPPKNKENINYIK